MPLAQPAALGAIVGKLERVFRGAGHELGAERPGEVFDLGAVSKGESQIVLGDLLALFASPRDPQINVLMGRCRYACKQPGFLLSMMVLVSSVHDRDRDALCAMHMRHASEAHLCTYPLVQRALAAQPRHKELASNHLPSPHMHNGPRGVDCGKRLTTETEEQTTMSSKNNACRNERFVDNRLYRLKRLRNNATHHWANKVVTDLVATCTPASQEAPHVVVVESTTGANNVAP